VLRKLRAVGWNEAITYAPIRNSLRLTYCEKLPGGHRVRSLSQLGPEFIQIMNAEKCFGLFSQRNQTDTATERRTAEFYPRKLGAQNMATVKDIDVHGELAAERGRLSKLREVYTAARVRLIELQTAKWEEDNRRAGPPAIVEEWRRAAMAEAVDALVDGREPDPLTMQGGEKLEIQLAATKTKLEIAEVAQSQQARLVQDLTAKVRAAELPGKLARVEPLRLKVRAAFDALIEALADFLEACAAEGVAVDAFADLPGDVRSGANLTLNQAARTLRQLIGYGLRKVRAA
jgi:hypothetical protein